jgi:hypothetical protein
LPSEDFGFEMISCFRKRKVGIREFSSIETKSCHTFTRVVYVIGYTKCTQTPKIIPCICIVGKLGYKSQLLTRYYCNLSCTECAIFFDLLRPQGTYARKKNGGKCQSGTLNHQNGRNDVLITYCTGDWLAKFGFVPACIDNCNLSYHGSAQQLCTQGRNDISVRGGCRPC